MRALRSADVQLNVLKGGGHRLSEPHEIDAILRTVAALAGARTLIPLLLPLAAAAAAAPARIAAAPTLVTPDALVCRALAAQKSGDNEAAAQAFEEAAKASPDKDPRTARMWAAAGNLWIAANQPGKAAARPRQGARAARARSASSAARPCSTAPAPPRRRTTSRPRARKAERGRGRRSPTIPSTGISRLRSRSARATDGTAQSAISKALTLAPSDPAILFEAGHVADFNGDDEQARSYWMRAAGSDPNGPIGKAAAKAVEMLGVTPTVKTDASPAEDALAEVVVDRRHDADLLERRAPARRAAVVAILAVARRRPRNSPGSRS